MGIENSTETVTALGGVVAGVLAGVAGMFGLRKSENRRDESDTGHLRDRLSALESRTSIQEALMQMVLDQIRDLRAECQDRDKAIFDKLDRLAEMRK